MERQDLSHNSHTILERKFQYQARQEDFLTGGKVRVRENLSGKSSALGGGISHVMVLPYSHFPQR